MIYITKRKGLYQNKANYSLVSTCKSVKWAFKNKKIKGRFHYSGTYVSSSAKPCSHQLYGDPFLLHECSCILAVTNGRLPDDYRIRAPV